MKLIKKIVTHLHPHLDEFLAGLLVKMFGLKDFHILSNVEYKEICFSSEDLDTFSRENPDCLCIGIGGGPFDDHGQKARKSASLLMSEYLGLTNDPRLIVLVELVTRHDKEKSTSPDQFTLPRAINFMHRYGYTPKSIREWVEQGLRGLIESEALLLEKIKSEIGKMASKEAFRAEVKTRFFNENRKWDHFNLTAISETLGESGKAWVGFADGAFEKQRVAFKQALAVAEKSIESTPTKFGKIRMMLIDGSDGVHSLYEIELDACSRHAKVRADLVLVQNSLGHTLIAVNDGFKGSLAGFLKVLRMAEAKKRNLELLSSHLIMEGSVPVEGLTSWYAHEGIGLRRIYNGTTTRPVVDISELTFDEKKSLLLDWLEVSKFTVMPVSKKDPVSVGEAFKAADAG